MTSKIKARQDDHKTRQSQDETVTRKIKTRQDKKSRGLSASRTRVGRAIGSQASEKMQVLIRFSSLPMAKLVFIHR